MTDLRLRLSPAPSLQARVLTYLPGTIAGGTAVIVSKAGTVYTISIDVAAIAAVVGSNFQPIDTDLSAIASLSTTGILARVGAGAWALRAITGTANEITVTNGDGVAGAPTVSLPSTISFAAKTVIGGTFTGGRVRQLVPRSLRRGRPAALLGARPAPRSPPKTAPLRPSLWQSLIGPRCRSPRSTLRKRTERRWPKKPCRSSSEETRTKTESVGRAKT